MSRTMRSFNSLLGGVEEEEEEESDGRCGLSYQERIYGFAACLAGGLLCTLLSLLLIFRPIKFAVTFTFGNLLSLASTAFLVGPIRQVNMMFDPARIIASAVFIGSIVIALVCALYIHNRLLTLIAIIIEFCALICMWAVFEAFGQTLCQLNHILHIAWPGTSSTAYLISIKAFLIIVSHKNPHLSWFEGCPCLCSKLLS